MNTFNESISPPISSFPSSSTESDDRLFPKRYIELIGAKEHNLKNINVKIPRDSFVVITGLSGSGKSSLAIDTIFAEGQRRFIESLSSYARQFVGKLEKPKVDQINGLSPAICIDQKTTSANPRSTVGTITEIYDYLRVLYAAIGIPHCPICHRELKPLSAEEIVHKILELDSTSKIQIYAPLVRERKGHYKSLFKDLIKEGYYKVRIDGKLIDLTDQEPELDKNFKHTIDLLIDRVKLEKAKNNPSRLTDAIETALLRGKGLVKVFVNTPNSDHTQELLYSEHGGCPIHGVSISELEPRMFSFNAPQGACPECTGIGYKLQPDVNLIIPDPSLSIREGGIATIGTNMNTWTVRVIEAIGKEYGFTLDMPIKDFPKEGLHALLYGTNRRIKITHKTDEYNWESFRTREGIIPTIQRRYMQTHSESARKYYESFMSHIPCPSCGGKRLNPISLNVTVSGKDIISVTELSIKKALEFFNSLKLTPQEEKIAEEVLKEIRERLKFLDDIGLSYLTLSRNAGTLSGGEAQRIRLATQIGSKLVGVLYVLDEPSIGLHQKDNAKLIQTFKDLRNLGNTVIVIEHDLETIEAADYILDLGPEAGENGGYVVAQGTVEDIRNAKQGYTAKYLSGELEIPIPQKRRKPKAWLQLKGVKHNNLKNIDVDIPLGVFVCVTGVSGSGKSSLVHDVLWKALARKFYKSRVVPGKHDKIEGLQNLDKVLLIDQSPIGRTPRSNPATYTKVFDHIRKLFAELPESKKRGYKPGRFSFNVKGGRCEVCSGNGNVKVELHFLPDVYVECDTCHGKRFNSETLQVKYKGKNISEVLDMTIDEAYDFFENIPEIKRRLEKLKEVGCGYLKLGQSSVTLSGGEAQRIKLSRELGKKTSGNTLILMDEPTTGLHLHDVAKLIQVIHKLVDNGNTVLLIEHHMDIIANADWVIDLGPEAGDEGGEIIAQGTPEQIMKNPRSYTGKYLAELYKTKRQKPKKRSRKTPTQSPTKKTKRKQS